MDKLRLSEEELSACLYLPKSAKYDLERSVKRQLVRGTNCANRARCTDKQVMDDVSQR